MDMDQCVLLVRPLHLVPSAFFFLFFTSCSVKAALALLQNPSLSVTTTQSKPTIIVASTVPTSPVSASSADPTIHPLHLPPHSPPLLPSPPPLMPPAALTVRPTAWPCFGGPSPPDFPPSSPQTPADLSEPMSGSSG